MDYSNTSQRHFLIRFVLVMGFVLGCLFSCGLANVILVIFGP